MHLKQHVETSIRIILIFTLSYYPTNIPNKYIYICIYVLYIHIYIQSFTYTLYE